MPYFSGDKNQALRLANWINRLTGVKHHDCLLVIDKGTDEFGVIEPLREAFNTVTAIFADPAGSQGAWGTGTTDATAANQMFHTAAIYIYHKLKVPFFWMEPDAVQIYPKWLDDIEAEYKGCGKPFMGMYVDIPPHEPHMSGVGLYPFDVANHSLAMMDPPMDSKGGRMAWDYAGRGDTVARHKAHFTNRIQHVYRVHGQSPTFPTIESLSEIKRETAVYHRCKDDSLVNRLMEQEETRPTINGDSVPIDSQTQATVGEYALRIENGQLKEKIRQMESEPDADAPSTQAPGTLAEQIVIMAKALARISASKHERAQMVQDALLAENLISQKGGDASCQMDTVTKSATALTANSSDKACSKSARKVRSPRAAKRGKRMKQRPARTPERIAADKDRMAKARAGIGAKA